MKHYYKIGEISELYHIGPDSIRYYEELGILMPKRDTNGYRMYSIHDLWRLNVIRDLRSLGFSMARIKEYMDHRSIETTEELLEEELEIITQKIQVLTELKDNVTTRLDTIKETKQHPIGVITKTYIPLRHCHMIHSGYELDDEMDMLIKQLLNRDKSNLYIIGNNRIGSMIHQDSIFAKKYRDYESVFIIDKHGTDTLPSGNYLTLCYHGDSNQNTTYIPQLLEYAKKQNLIPAGPVLELLWVDIHQAANLEEHITELQLPLL
ncbi:MAG: MerR family transcriptional regulator [Lachnospiraceae bacterium]